MYILLPNEHASYIKLFDNIQCNDAELCAAVSMVRNCSVLNSKMNDFEETATYTLPYDPFYKKIKVRKKRTQAKIFNMIEDACSDVSVTHTK